MSPNYGCKARPAGDVVPDWLLGGNRKRRVLYALAHPAPPDGWKAAELAEELGCGRATVFEIVRGLRPLDVIARDDTGRLKLDPATELGAALVDLLRALDAFAEEPVNRPPRSRQRRS